jgi:hypothetical protein
VSCVCARLDFLVVVAFPILMVSYCLSSFSLDHTKISINLAVFPNGWFERNASVIADPVQTEVIYAALKSLQILSAVDFCLRVGIHGVFSFRLLRVADLVQTPSRRPTRLYPKRHFGSAMVMVLFAVGLAVFVHKSMWTSALACQPHPQCAVNAHRWTIAEQGALTQCPCLTLVDEVTAPKSFAEWMQPVDVTEKVAQLATTGDLRTIRLVNRYFPVLPDELRTCRQLRHLSVRRTSSHTSIYSLICGLLQVARLHVHGTPARVDQGVPQAGIPVRCLASQIRRYRILILWIVLYRYIEGSFTNSLVELPDDMFASMGSLAFIHLGLHLHLQYLPSFDGLVGLKALTLAMLVSLVDLPRVDSLYSLERLVMSFLPSIETLPDLKPLHHLKAFSVNARGSWCCNGFLGDCDVQDPFCAAQPFWGIPQASCLPDTVSRATTETVAVLTQFSDTVCRPEQSQFHGPAPPTPERSAQCGGVLYRRCSIPGHDEAMCYSARFMGISCDEGPLAIKMRRRQIQLGVSEPCDPEFEAWLGCR